MPVKITGLTALDVRFPTSRSLDGSDAMHTSPDYSAAYVILHTDAGEGLSGHGLTFTCGRGNEVCVAGIRALEPLVVGRSLEGITGDLRAFWRSLVSDGQLRWIGPEKGAMHMAVGAVVNAVWDLWAKSRGVPLWRLLLDLGPGGARGRDRFPVHRRHSRSRRRQSISFAPRSPAARNGSWSSSRRATRRIRRRSGGWATTTKRWRSSSAARSPMGSAT